MWVLFAAQGLDRYDDRRSAWFIFSAVANIGGFLLLLYGLKQFFTDEIRSELRDLAKQIPSSKN